MPYFAWRGVDIVGSYKRGKQFAKSAAQLDEALFRRGVALITSRSIKVPLLSPRITDQDLAICFQQLAVLVDAGILVHQALVLVACQLRNVRLQGIVHAVADEVCEGKSLTVAL